jgi:hypothetical protein
MANMFLDSAPTLAVSAYPSRKAQDVVISMPYFFQLVNQKTFLGPSNLPIESIHIQLKKGASPLKIRNLTGVLSKALPYENVVYIEDRLQNIYVASNTLSWMFQIITLLILAVAFFSLNSEITWCITMDDLQIVCV